jgi:uncharacterized protein YjbI with pentapeptide repeats
VNLAGARLNGADFSGADLRESLLIRADLSEAILSRANLVRADLQGANLRAAILSDATTGDRLLLRPSQSSGELVFCLSRACSLLGGAAFGPRPITLLITFS